mmetsp:Transcript_22090/g.25552  ORF Transcript_22090/g.25552 Transcript_22090/m.25552 type:complete len:146 (-) Transcript_22090:69-506(-)
MDQIDHISNRLTVSTITGLVAGSSIATYKALPLPRTSLSVAATFALASTACLIPERIFYEMSFNVIEKRCDEIEKDHDYFSMEKRRIFASHIAGGVIGGGICGGLYQKRPMGGIALFIPIMIGVAFAENYVSDLRKQRLNEIRNK